MPLPPAGGTDGSNVAPGPPDCNRDARARGPPRSASTTGGRGLDWTDSDHRGGPAARVPSRVADVLGEFRREEAPSPRPRRSPTPGGPAPRSPLLRFLDCAGVGLFLALTFLLGAFPLKDTDFWWHLKTGDLIRQTGRVPTVDLFTFSVPPETPWIDLHWIFQVALSWGYAHGGVVALNLAKCAITCVAVLLLVTARRRGGPSGRC